jgi:protein TonB
MKQSLQQSLIIHLCLAAVFLLGGWILGSGPRAVQKIRVSIQEVPHVEPQKPAEPPVIQVSPQKAEAPAKIPRKVFGITKDTLKSDKPGAVEVKTGNTLAKEIDQEKMNPDDATALPVPAEEYLVSQMPKLKSEVRIPYPPEAKAKNVEGVVVMDVLIDAAGKVREAKLLEGPGFGLNEAAMKAIYSFEFSPAVIDKKPVAVRIRYAYRFVLN